MGLILSDRLSFAWFFFSIPSPISEVIFFPLFMYVFGFLSHTFHHLLLYKSEILWFNILTSRGFVCLFRWQLYIWSSFLMVNSRFLLSFERFSLWVQFFFSFFFFAGWRELTLTEYRLLNINVVKVTSVWLQILFVFYTLFRINKHDNKAHSYPTRQVYIYYDVEDF